MLQRYSFAANKKENKKGLQGGNNSKPPQPTQIKTLRGKRGKSGRGFGDEAEFITKRELAPECLLFPKKAVGQFLRGLNTSESFPYTVRLGYDAAATTDGSGILATVISSVPTGAQNWSSYASTFDEYRVLATIVKFEPLRAVGGSTTLFWAPIAHVADRSDGTPLTGYALAERYQSHRKTPGGQAFSVVVNMNSVEEASFLSTGGSTAFWWTKFYSSGNSSSTTLGRLDVVYIVQFRGFGIN